jgi:hypothetical protein
MESASGRSGSYKPDTDTDKSETVSAALEGGRVAAIAESPQKNNVGSASA